jgi:DNA invertase Pin-like site-specific DNA recombinase
MTRESYRPRSDRTLKPKIVRRIRELRAGGMPRTSVAKMYGISASVVQGIDEGRTYKEIK